MPTVRPLNKPLISSTDPRKAWIVLGSGGVGKTTLSAALALALTERGHRTAVVTLDPARRLADALGISRTVHGEQRVPLERIERRHGVRFPAELHGGVLDTKAMFDEQVRELMADRGGDPERILANPYYGKLSTSLAGAEDFMSVAKLDALIRSDDYERVVFDTPPTFHTFDFLDTPERMASFFKVPGVRAAMRLMDGPVQGWAPLVRVGRLTLRGLERFLGREFIQELFGFIGLFRDVLESFAERAEAVHEILTSDQVGYVLVLAPNERSVSEGELVLKRFAEEGRDLHRVVFNRVHPSRFDARRVHALEEAVAQAVATLPAARLFAGSTKEGFMRRLPHLVATYEATAARERVVMERFRQRHGDCVEIHELPTAIDDLEGLYEYARALPVG